MRIHKALWVVVGLGSALGAAHAQTAATDSTGGSEALQEIIVTAQRRSEDVQHAALAIDVISPAAMGIAGVTRASDLTSLVPALQISESGNSQQSLYIRSVGTFVAQSYTDPAVAFNVDGIAIGRPSSMTGVMYDMDRTEVLKGPQGTLYGRNATGGAINVIPNQPKIGVASGEVALTVGNYGTVHPEAAVNFALNDSSAARVALTYTKHDGYQSDGTGDTNEYAGRAQYLFKPDETFSVRLAADYDHDGGHNVAGTVMAIQNPFTGAIRPSPLGRDVGALDPRVTSLLQGQYSFISGRFLDAIQGTPRADNRYWGVMSEITWHSPVGTLTVLPSHRESRLDDLSTSFAFGSIAQEKDSQSSLEVRMSSDNQGWLRWLVGGYFFHETIDAIYQFDQQALAPVQTLNTGTLSKAGFARLTFAPTDDFRVSAGIRYTDDRKTLDGQSQVMINACTRSSPIPACPGTPLFPPATSVASYVSQLSLFPIIPNTLYGSTLPGAANSVFPLVNIPINQAQVYTKVTWHAGVEYDLGKNSLLYANWDTGYHAGGFAFARIKPTFAPELLTAYSIGSKNRFLHDTLELNVEGFFWRYTDEQISHGGTDLNGAYVFYTDNAGSSIIKGLETSVKYLLPTHTLFTADVQYLGAAYNHFTYQTPAGGFNPPPVTSCPFAQTDAKHYTVNCAGKTALQSPRWTGNVALQQTLVIGDYSLIGEIGAHAQTDSIVGFEMLPVEVQKTYAEGNASLSLVPSHGNWSVMAFVNNFTDRRPYGISYYDSVMGLIGAGVGAPRIEGVRATYKF
jgi:iron complex outermembrane receptor protein